MGQLEGKVAIVTGASRGIGAAAAFVLAKAGATISTNGSVKPLVRNPLLMQE